MPSFLCEQPTVLCSSGRLSVPAIYVCAWVEYRSDGQGGAVLS